MPAYYQCLKCSSALLRDDLILYEKDGATLSRCPFCYGFVKSGLGD